MQQQQNFNYSQQNNNNRGGIFSQDSREMDPEPPGQFDLGETRFNQQIEEKSIIFPPQQQQYNNQQQQQYFHQQNRNNNDFQQKYNLNNNSTPQNFMDNTNPTNNSNDEHSRSTRRSNRISQASSSQSGQSILNTADTIKNVRPNRQYRNIQGVALLFIHQVDSDLKFINTEILNEIELKNNIQILFKSLQRSYITERQNAKDKRKYPHFSDGEIQIDHFQFNRINCNHWPYLVSYDIQISFSNSYSDKTQFLFYTDCSYAVKNKMQDIALPHQVSMLVTFWNKRYEFSQLRKPQRIIDNFLDIIEEYEKFDHYDKKTLEIKEEEFDKYYQYLMYIGGGSYGKVDLYYDIREDKVVAVKYFLQKNLLPLHQKLQGIVHNIEKPKKQYNKKNKKEELNQQPIFNSTCNKILQSLNDDELHKITEGIRTLKFDDSQIPNVNRNIVREISQSYLLNSSENINRKYITRLEGVVLCEKQKKQGLNLKNNDKEPELRKKVKIDENNNDLADPYNQDVDKLLDQEEEIQEEGKSVKIVFEYFGSCEVKNKKMYCDLFNYITNNQALFTERKKVSLFIKDVFSQILKCVECIHNSGVVLRDFKDDNILVRRLYNEYNLKAPQFEIKLCDFGLSKNDNNGGRQRSNSVDYDVVNEFRHPRFHQGKTQKLIYHQKDDVFGIGILLLRMYSNFPHKLHSMDNWTKELIQYLTGLSNKALKTYQYWLAQQENEEKNNRNNAQKKQQLQQENEGEKNKAYVKLIQQLEREKSGLQECWESIPHISEIFYNKYYQDWMEKSTT